MALVLIAACSAPAAVDDPAFAIRLDEWTVGLSAAAIESGPLQVEVVNDGLLMHEAVIVATKHSDQRLSTVGGLVDIADEDVELVGELAELSPQDDIGVEMDLEPGTYIVFCNIPGHYDAGMSAVLTVEP